MGCLKLTYQKNNFLQVVHRKNEQSQKKNALDYFSFGMPMPNRQIVNGEPYRYAYQGQEKDPETGKEAFQLRLWDGRIGRWLSPDPYAEFFSPYLGMGNNPANTIDPDGGCTTCPDNAKKGQTFAHSDYGTLTSNGTGEWFDSSGGVIGNNITISTNSDINLVLNQDYVSQSPQFAGGGAYQYNIRDFRVAIDVMSGPNNPIKTAMRSQLQNPRKEPLSAYNYRMYYGDRKAQLNTGTMYATMVCL